MAESFAYETCIPSIDGDLFELGCLGPALAIILILASLERRKNWKLEYFDGRPGLLIPVNFFSKHNRLTIAATFGATASTCLLLFQHAFGLGGGGGLISLKGPPWLKVFQSLVLVIFYGILFFPYFACLTTEYRLIGSVLGFLYAAIRFSLRLVIDFECSSSYRQGLSRQIFLTKLSSLPTHLCLLFITIRFAVLVFLEVRKKWFHSTSSSYRATQGDEPLLIREPGIKHVKQLLNRGSNQGVEEVRWFMKAIYFFYKPRTDFEFSTQLISTMIVSAIIIFQAFGNFRKSKMVNSRQQPIEDDEGFVANLILFDALKQTYLANLCANNDGCNAEMRVFYDSLTGGFVLSALVSALLLVNFMKCHRDNLRQLYRGQRTFFQSVCVSPSKSVMMGLRFSGYQIAFTLAGFFFLGFLLFIACLLLGLLTFKVYRDWAIGFLPTIGMAIALLLFQLFLAKFVLRDRDLPDLTISVDNRRLFSIMSYFFFFYNILLGFFSYILRLLPGIVFLSRIDRSSFTQGLQKFDKAFVAYLGFVNVLVAHTHPVMLMFCQLLVNRNKDRGPEEPNTKVPQERVPRLCKDSGGSVVYKREARLPRMSQKAVNRWHVAVMLLRNPSLITSRRQGGSAYVVRLGSISADINALV